MLKRAFIPQERGSFWVGTEEVVGDREGKVDIVGAEEILGDREG